MKSGWRGKAEFAEFAEAVGKPTDCIMAAGMRRGVVMVLWTNDADGDLDTDVYASHFERDDEGLLVPTSEVTVTGKLGDIVGWQ